MLWIVYLIIKLKHEDYFNLKIHTEVLEVLVRLWLGSGEDRKEFEVEQDE